MVDRSKIESEEKLSFMKLMKEKSHSICLLTSSGRGKTIVEETLEAERLHGFKVGKDFSPYTL